MLALGLAGGALLVRGALAPASLWRYVLLTVALVLIGLVVAFFVAVATADSLW
jgi:hypothetical protein